MRNLFFPLLISLFLFTGCLDESGPPEQNLAVAIIEAEFVDVSDNEEPQPIASTQMGLFVNVEGDQQNIPVAEITTDENGIIQTDISAGNEITVTNIIFEFELNGQTHTVQEQVSLQLSFEEPFDEVNLFFEVGADTDDNGDDNGDEENGGDDGGNDG